VKPLSKQDFPQEFFLGPLRIFPNVNLSSMHGVSDYAFRRLIANICGGKTGWMITEFVSSSELVKNNPRAKKQLKYHESERPFGVQIYGGNPEEMGKAAEIVQDIGADYLEINCGCPAPKVVRRQCGSGLLLDLNHYRKVLAGVKKVLKIPLSVKARIGYFDRDINALETLQIAEEEGAEMFVVHGRTKQQGYKGKANWDVIKKVKQAAHIPVIGNGDILTIDDVIQKLGNYGVDGLSIGRGALHHPWIFRQVLELYNGQKPSNPTLQEQFDAVKLYHQLLLDTYDYPKAVFTRGELAMVSAIFFAELTLRAFFILISINLVAPSPSLTILRASP